MMILTFITELFESAKIRIFPYFPAKKLSNRGVHLFYPNKHPDYRRIPSINQHVQLISEKKID